MVELPLSDIAADTMMQVLLEQIGKKEFVDGLPEPFRDGLRKAAKDGIIRTDRECMAWLDGTLVAVDACTSIAANDEREAHEH